MLEAGRTAGGVVVGRGNARLAPRPDEDAVLRRPGRALEPARLHHAVHAARVREIEAGGAARWTRERARGRVRDEPGAERAVITYFVPARGRVVRGQHARGVPGQLAVDDVRERVERAFRVLDPSARRHDDERAGRAMESVTPGGPETSREVREQRGRGRRAARVGSSSARHGFLERADAGWTRGASTHPRASTRGRRSRSRVADRRWRRRWCVPPSPLASSSRRAFARAIPLLACFGAPRAFSSRHLPPSPPRLTRRPSHASPRLPHPRAVARVDLRVLEHRSRRRCEPLLGARRAPPPVLGRPSTRPIRDASSSPRRFWMSPVAPQYAPSPPPA